MKQHNKSNQLDHILYSAVGITLAGTILSVLTLSLSSVHATSGTASGNSVSTAHVSVGSSCSMTANITSAHTASIPNGIWSGGSGYYPDGIGQTIIQTFCNDANGYSMYAIGFTGNSINGNNTVLHSNELGNEADIITGTAQGGDTSNWAMKVTKVTDSSQSHNPSNLTIQNDFDDVDYHSVPSTYTEVARYSSTTDLTLGSKLETTYSAYVSPSQPAGEYEGKVKYVLVHPGGSTAPVDTMQNVANWAEGLVVGEEATAIDSRDGQSYTVARLCTNYDSSNNCTSSQIWMTQNLNLQIGGTGVTLNSINTDLNNPYEPDGTTLKKDYSISGSTITWAPTTANTTASGVSTNNTLTGTPATISDFSYSDSTTSVVTGWNNQSYYGYQAEGNLNGTEQYEWPGTSSSHIEHGSLADCVAAGFTEAVCGHYKIGNYYNFTAANAMSDSTQYTTAYSVMDNSICPKGWRLPKGITNNGTVMSEFNQLLNAQGVTNGTDLAGGTNVGYVSGGFDRLVSTGIHGDPLYFARSGDVNGTTLYDSANDGRYWSSTVTPIATYGYDLVFYSGGIWPAAQNDRSYGFSLRCLARE